MSAAAEPAFSRRSIVALIVLLAACFAVSAIGGALTQPNLDWYATLTKPGFAPPNGAFPIVWTILYVMMAVAAWLVWRSAGDAGDKKTALIWFGIQLAMNVLWSFAFFFLQRPDYGFGVIMALLVAIVITIVLFARLSRTAALLLVPYLLWVCFATGLNFTIWVLNSGYDFSQTPS
jgi:tryptophan-rich sensory protein